MRTTHVIPAAVAAAVLLSSPSLAAPKTVQVDCTKGKSIQAALASNGDPLTLEIIGLCVENVVVRRDNVTFLGSDPTVDGIRAASTAESFSGAVVVREARNIHFQNLQFAGGGTSGLRVENARRNITADNCLFHDNGTWGAIVVGGVLDITGSTVRDNHTSGRGGGLTAAESGQVYCDDCTIVDNPDPSDGTGVDARTGGIAVIFNSFVDGVQNAVTATSGGTIQVRSSDLTGSERSIAVGDRSRGFAENSNVSGRIGAFGKSRLELFDVVQTASPGSNIANGDSFVEIFATGPGASALVEDLLVFGFSVGGSIGPVSYAGIVCTAGSEFACDGLESKTSSSCGACP